MNEKTRLLIPGKIYRYHLINTGQSSAKFGNCQVCAGHVSEVWRQVEERQYQPEPEEWLFLEANNIPDGFIIGSQQAHPNFKSFGTIDYPEPLTSKQASHYDMVLVSKPAEENTEALAPAEQ